MNDLNIVKGYLYGDYILFETTPKGFIEYGSSQKELYFDYDRLTIQWQCSKDLLDMLTDFNIELKQAKCVSYDTLDSLGVSKLVLINAEVVPTLIKKLKETGQCPELDAVKEIELVNKMTEAVRKENKWDAKKTARQPNFR